MRLKWAGLLAMAAGAGISPAAAQEKVTLPGKDVPLRAAIYRPSGAGPHPAIVALHGCGGLWSRDRPDRPSRRHRDWAARLAAQGFIVVMPDSFGSRGLGPQCEERRRRVRPGIERVEDANAAQRWLAAQPFVQPHAINLLGWSHGGATVLHVLRNSHGFRKAVAFYPGCRTLLERGGWVTKIPLMLLIGEDDNWTPPQPCKALAEKAGALVTYISYPGAVHGFDTPDSPVRERSGAAYSADGTGVVKQGTNEKARADVLQRVPRFFQP